MNNNSIPGIRGVDHVGFTVPDINEAVQFFTDVLDCKEAVRFGPFRDDEGDSMKELFNLPPRAVIKTIVLMRSGRGSNIELFEFEVEEQRKQLPRNCDLGGFHFSFYVYDIFKALEAAKKMGVNTFAGPLEVNDGPAAGMKVLYFLAPWGTQLELISYPDGVAYEKNATTKLWAPE